MRSIIKKLGLMINRQRILIFAVIFTCFAAVTYALIFDLLPPGEIFRPPLIVLIPAGLLITAFVLTWALILLKPVLNPFLERIKSAETGMILRITIILLLAAAFLAAIAGFSSIARALDRDEIKAAKDDFEVVLCGQVSRVRAESTLIKLEKAVSSLRQKYGACYLSRCCLYLYPDVETMQRETAANREVLGFVNFENGYAVLCMPAGPLLDPLIGRNCDSTIRHEALHLVIAEILGETAMRKVPCWFHEGLACYEGLNNGRFLDQRIKLKYELWSGETQRTPPDTLLVNKPDQQSIDHSFYLTSTELVRYMLATRGENVPYSILRNIMRDCEFEAAFKATCGTGTLGMYNEWCSRYF